MKKTTIQALSTILVLTSISVLASGTDTWVGNTDANWSTAANWSAGTGGSTPPANRDSLVFGAAGSAGTSLNNDLSGVTINNFLISGSAAFTFGGNAVTLGGALTNAASAAETFSSGIAIAGNSAAAIKNTGGGTLALGALTKNTGGTVDFANSSGSITTTTANDATGILGGWATTGNSVSSATTGDWVATNGSGNIITYAGYTTTGTPSGTTMATANYKGAFTNTVDATINSLVENNDISIANGTTLTINSGGIILWGPSKWFKAGGSTSALTSGASTGELFVHTPNAAATDYRIWPIIKDGAVPTILVKDGPGYLRLEGVNTYSGGMVLNGGTLAVGIATAFGSGSLTLNAGTVQGNASSANFGSAVPNNLIINGNIGFYLAKDATYSGTITGSGTLDNTVATGGASWNINGDLSGFSGTLKHASDSSHNNVNIGGSTINSLSATNATFVLSGTSGGARKLSVNGNGVGVFQLGNISGSSGSLLLNNTLAVGYLNLDSSYGGLLLNGVNSPGLTKVGTGTLTLSAANTYPGATTIENGGLVAGANVSVSASGPFGNAASAIALGYDTTITDNKNVSLLIGGAFTMARSITVGSNPNATTGLYTIGGNSANSATFSGAITLNQNLVITQATGGILTISGAISGSTGLMKVGNGTVKLSGVNSSYYGSVTVSNGVFVVAAQQSGGMSGTATVMDGASAGVSASADAVYWTPSSLTVGSSTGGSLQFGVTGTTTAPLQPSSLVLNGTTTINISSAPMANNVSYPLFTGYASQPLVLGTQPGGLFGQLTTSGGTVYYQVTNMAPTIWTAKVNTNWDTTTANWTNSIGGNLFTANAPVQFDDSAIGTSPLLVSITPSTVAPGSIVVSNTAKTYVIGGLGISGAAGLNKIGNNTLTLTSTNTFTGDITISAGSVEVGATGQLGGGSYAGNINDNSILSINTTAAQSLAGTISGTGALVKNNTGTLTLPVANSYNGGTTLSNGTVVLGNDTGLGSGTVTLAGGTLLSSATVNLGNSVVAQAGTSSTIDVNGGNLTMNGGLSGGGTITRGSSAAMSLYLVGDNSGFTGVYQDQNNGNSITRWGSANAGSANARWIFNQAQNNTRTAFDFGSGTIQFGSISGAGFVAQNVAGQTATMEVGALGLNDTFAGVIAKPNSGNVILSKVGTGTLTLSGANAFTGGVNINGGTLSVSNTLALSTAGTIAFGGGTLQYTPANQVDYSSRIGNSTSNISIDVNGTNVTFATALPSSNTGGLALTNSTGSGVLMLAASNLYTGPTLIGAGTLMLVTNGNLALSSNIMVASGAVFDVSAVNYTLLGGQTISGYGTVTGAVTTAGSSAAINPGDVGVAGTLAFKNNLNLTGGASPVFDLSTSHLSGNDQVAVAGNLSLGSSDTIHINALSGSANLDQSADYVLFSVAGTTTITGHPALVFDNTAPANFSHYSISTSGNNVVLHYSVSSAPIILSVVVTNTVDGSATAVRGQSVTVYATVQPGTGLVTNVSANLSLLGGSASQTLTALGGNNYSYTLQVGPGATLGTDTINVTATDTTPLSGFGSANVTINASTETWSGLGSDNLWSSGANWVSTLPPGYAGDTLVFTGGTRTTPDMETNYNVNGLTFDGSAANFVIGSTTSKTLTLSGGVTNSSGNAQVLNMVVVLNGTQTIDDQLGMGITLGGPISGSGGLTMAPASSANGVLTLSGSNTYSGDTTIPLFVKLVTANSNAIPSGAGTGTVNVNGTLDLSGTNAVINGLSGAGTVDNSSGTAVTLTVGNGGASGNFSGSIQNSGGGSLSLVKVGTNTLTLSGGNSFSGGATLSAGQVTLGNGSALGSGSVTLNGGTLQLNAQTIGNNLVAATGTASILENSGNNGTLNGNLTGNGTITIQNSSGNNLSDFINGDWSGFSGTLNYYTANKVINIFTPGTSVFDLSQVTLNVTNTPNLNSSSFRGGAGQVVKLGSLAGPSGYLDTAGTFEIGYLNTSTTFGGQIRDNGSSGGVSKVGTGTLTLTGANSYTGPTIVSNGTLNVSSLSIGAGTYSLQDGASLGVSVASSGSCLKVASLTFGNNCTNSFTALSSTTVAAITNEGTLTLAGTVTVNVGGAVFVGQYPLITSTSIAGTGSFVLGSLPPGAAATIGTNGSTIVLNVTTGSLPYVWTGLNNANWDLSTLNNWSYNNATTVYSDNVFVQFDDSSTQTNVLVATNVAPTVMLVSNTVHSYTFAGAAITGSGSLTKNGNNTLTLVNTNTFTGGTTISAGTLQIGDGTARNGALAGNIIDNANLTVANPLDQTLANVVGGSGSFAKTGAGTLTVSGANTFSGITAIKQGAVNISAANNLSTNTVVLGDSAIGADAALQMTAAIAVGNNITVAPGAGARKLANSSSTTATYSGNVALSNNLTVVKTGAQDLNLGGVFTGSGNVTVSNTAGIVWFNTASPDWAGSLIIQAGNVRPGTAAMQMNTNTVLSINTGAFFNVGGANYDLNFAGFNDIPGATGGGMGGGGATHNIVVNGSGTYTYSGVYDSRAWGLAVNLAATGKQILTGNSTFDHGGTINSGTLQLDGSVNGALTVNGGTLAGSGTVSNSVTVNASGRLSPGTSIGTFNVISNLTLTGNAFIEVNKGLSPAQSNGTVNVTGTLTYGGTITVTNAGPALVAGDSFRVFKSGGTGTLTVNGNAGIGLAFSFADGVVSVVTAGPSGPATITNSVSGNTLNLSWPAGQGWRLQAQTNSLAVGLTTNGWVDVTTTDGSYSATVNPSNATVFYRLVYP